jgi:glycosyltransferase involved in cell wall biosynthesis
VKPLVIDLEPAWRGGQNQALLLLTGLRQRGHTPELLAAAGSALGERAQSLGLGVHFVSRGGFRLPAARKIRALLRTGNFDLVHANEAHAVSAVWLARAHRHVPVIISRRVGYPIGKSRVARARYAAATKIIANSQWVARQAADSGAPRETITVVYEGTEISAPFTPEQKREARRRWNVADDELLLGCVGVLSSDKGQEFLIRSLAQLIQQSFSQSAPSGSRPQFSAIKLLLAGDGPCRSQLEALANELNVAESVIFAGFIKDVKSVYAALDIFLLPSLFEALNNSLLAAMAYEIPSVAFDRGALGEIIQDNINGKLVPAADVAALTQAIASLTVSDTAAINRLSAAAHNLGVAGRLRVQQNFSADRMVEETLRIYHQILGANS